MATETETFAHLFFAHVRPSPLLPFESRRRAGGRMVDTTVDCGDSMITSPHGDSVIFISLSDRCTHVTDTPIWWKWPISRSPISRYEYRSFTNYYYYCCCCYMESSKHVHFEGFVKIIFTSHFIQSKEHVMWIKQYFMVCKNISRDVRGLWHYTGLCVGQTNEVSELDSVVTCCEGKMKQGTVNTVAVKYHLWCADGGAGIISSVWNLLCLLFHVATGSVSTVHPQKYATDVCGQCSFITFYFAVLHIASGCSMHFYYSVLWGSCVHGCRSCGLFCCSS